MSSFSVSSQLKLETDYFWKFSSKLFKASASQLCRQLLYLRVSAAVIQLGTFLIFSYLASHRDNIRLLLSIVASVAATDRCKFTSCTA